MHSQKPGLDHCETLKILYPEFPVRFETNGWIWKIWNLRPSGHRCSSANLQRNCFCRQIALRATVLRATFIYHERKTKHLSRCWAPDKAAKNKKYWNFLFAPKKTVGILPFYQFNIRYTFDPNLQPEHFSTLDVGGVVSFTSIQISKFTVQALGVQLNM